MQPRLTMGGLVGGDTFRVNGLEGARSLWQAWEPAASNTVRMLGADGQPPSRPRQLWTVLRPSDRWDPPGERPQALGSSGRGDAGLMAAPAPNGAR